MEERGEMMWVYYNLKNIILLKKFSYISIVFLPLPDPPYPPNSVFFLSPSQEEEKHKLKMSF